MKDHCECPYEGIATDRRKYERKEWPGMKHPAGKCPCKADLAQYRSSDGIVRTLCSVCCLMSDQKL